MNILAGSRAYNKWGASVIYSFVADLLTMQLGEYGSAVELISITGCLRCPSLTPRPTLEQLFDQFNQHVNKLPKITFRRNMKQIDIDFLSKHFTSEDDEAWRASAEKCNVAAGEIAEALTLVMKRIKPTDDFDVKRFLADATALLSKQIDSFEEWQRIRSEANEKRLAIRAKKSPWELLEIDWSKYHPQAREILDDPFFWECADDLAPHGNDTGADLLEDYRRWDKRNGKTSPILFFARLMMSWDIKPIDWSAVDEETMLRLKKVDPIAFGLCNEAAIALAFAVIKMRGTCPEDVIKMALSALVRTAISVKHSTLSPEIKASWDTAIAKMRCKLESMLGRD